jgi:hypothetical protein
MTLIYRDVEGDIRIWRRTRLLEAGFEFDLATSLAREPSVDLHEVLDLVDRGCPPHLAARIVAPLNPVRRDT